MLQYCNILLVFLRVKYRSKPTGEYSKLKKQKQTLVRYYCTRYTRFRRNIIKCPNNCSLKRCARYCLFTYFRPFYPDYDSTEQVFITSCTL